MGGSSAVSGTYQRYKEDTDSVVAWLASTAKSLGFSATNSLTTATTVKPKDSGRRKGKARALKKAKSKAKAKAKAKAKKNDDTISTGTKHIIHIKDFVPLAKYIASKAVPVPNTFKATIDRVICMRSKFSDTLQRYGISVDEEENTKHQYFVQGE